MINSCVVNGTLPAPWLAPEPQKDLAKGSLVVSGQRNLDEQQHWCWCFLAPKCGIYQCKTEFSQSNIRYYTSWQSKIEAETFVVALENNLVLGLTDSVGHSRPSARQRCRLHRTPVGARLCGSCGCLVWRPSKVPFWGAPGFGDPKPPTWDPLVETVWLRCVVVATGAAILVCGNGLAMRGVA